MSNLIRDLAAAVVEFGVVQGGTRAKEIHVILEREQEEEHRHAVISNVSTQSQPRADLNQDSLHQRTCGISCFFYQLFFMNTHKAMFKEEPKCFKRMAAGKLLTAV